MGLGLSEWSRQKKVSRNESHQELVMRFEKLFLVDRDDDNLNVLVETRLFLSVEFDKDELY